MSYKIVPRYGHYELYINGNLYCTADSWNAAEREIENYEAEHCYIII